MRCAHCLHPIDRHADTEGDAKPRGGDFSVCFYCARINVLEDDGRALRKPTPSELEEFERDPRVQRAVAVVRSFGPPGSTMNRN